MVAHLLSMVTVTVPPPLPSLSVRIQLMSKPFLSFSGRRARNLAALSFVIRESRLTPLPSEVSTGFSWTLQVKHSADTISSFKVSTKDYSCSTTGCGTDIKFKPPPLKCSSSNNRGPLTAIFLICYPLFPSS